MAAEQAGEHGRSSPASVIATLKDNGPGPLAHDGTISSGIERSGGDRRIGDLVGQVVEAVLEHTEHVDSRSAPARNDNIGRSSLNETHALDNGQKA